jgi:hypothetical protein
MSDNSSTTITSQYLFQDNYHYNTNSQRPTFSWYATAKDTRENTNERTDQGSGIDRYSLVIQKSSNYQKTKNNANLPLDQQIPDEWEDVFEIPSIVFYPFKDQPESLKLASPYYKVETDKYTVEYLNFHDDLDHDTYPDKYTSSYDNNIIYLTTKDCVSPDPITSQVKDCWDEGEDAGKLMLSSGNSEAKYKWIIKAWDKAGNTAAAERIIYYKPQGYYGLGGSEVLAAEDSQAGKEEQASQVVKQPEVNNQSTGSSFNPSTFIILGLLFLSVPLALWLFLTKKSKKAAE